MLSVKDMEALICIHDAYEMLNTTLMGTELLVSPSEGVLGAFSRVHAVIENNVAERLKNNHYETVWKIVEDKSLTPKQQAEMLLEYMDKDSSG